MQELEHRSDMSLEEWQASRRPKPYFSYGGPIFLAVVWAGVALFFWTAIEPYIIR